MEINEYIPIDEHKTKIRELVELKKFVKDNTSQAAIYELLSEEAAELSFWAAKAARIIREEVPTPVSIMDAMKNVYEEYCDVINVAHVADILEADIDYRLEKMKRWKERIEKMEENNHE